MLPDLKVKIGADTEGLSSGLDTATGKLGGMQSAARRVGGAIDNVSSRAKALGIAMTKISATVGAVAGGLFAVTKASAENANVIGKAAKTAGLSAESFQELQFAVGQMADVSDGQFADAMQKLQRRSGEAAKGNDTYAEALRKVGVATEDIQSGAVTSEEVFTKLNAAMSSFESQAEAASVAASLLGERQGPKIAAAMRANVDALEEGRVKARETGQVLSGDFVRQSEALVDQLDVMSGKFEKLRADLAEKIIPVMTQTLIPAITDKVIPAIGALIEKIGDVIGWFQDLPGPVQEALGLVASALAVGGPVMVALGAFLAVLKGALLATGPIGLFIAAAALLVVAWQKWGDDIKEIVGGAVDWMSEKFTAFLAFVEAIPERFMAFGQAIVDGLRSGIAERWEAFMEFIREKMQFLPQFVRDMLESNSPSEVFARIGDDIMAGLALGIERSTGLVANAMGKTSDITTRAADDMATGVVGAMQSLFGRSKPLAIAQGLINTYQGITEALKLPFPANLAAAAQVAAQGFAAVRGIQSAKPGSTAGAAGGSSSPAPAPAALQVNASFQGDFFTRDQVQAGVTDLFDQLSDEAQRRGLNLAVSA